MGGNVTCRRCTRDRLYFAPFQDIPLHAARLRGAVNGAHESVKLAILEEKPPVVSGFSGRRGELNNYFTTRPLNQPPRHAFVPVAAGAPRTGPPPVHERRSRGGHTSVR